MHFGMIVIAIGLGLFLRFLWLRASSSSQTPLWTPTLAIFLCPPLLLWMTAIAILCMGHHGRMMGNSVGWVSCVIAAGWCLYGLGLLIQAGWQTWRSHLSLRQWPLLTLLPTVLSHGTAEDSIQVQKSETRSSTARLLDTSIPFAAQVGFWRSHLIVSDGILSHLPHEQSQAIVCHEQAHAHYRDCFWFFWLGWIRRMMSWMPATDALWQDLILLRELRADQWAARRVDRLDLAEALLQVSAQQLMANVSATVAVPDFLKTWFEDYPESKSAIAACTAAQNRLEVRIDALLTVPSPSTAHSYVQGFSWLTLASSCVPLLTLPLHH